MKKRWTILVCILCVASLLLLLSACGGKEAALIGEWKLEYAIDDESGEKRYADDLLIVLSFDKDGTGYYTGGIDANLNFRTMYFKWSLEGDNIVVRFTSFDDIPMIKNIKIQELSRDKLTLQGTEDEDGLFSKDCHFTKRG